jgi:bifunctional ADP-heptose synthase (sugar kinase/adenylyltransferase)
VTGFFDPLLAAHARRLEEIARRGGALLVAIQDPPRPLLVAQARAELVAALAVVDYVILAGTPAPGLAESIEADAVFHEEAADQCRTQELIQHVHDRHR